MRVWARGEKVLVKKAGTSKPSTMVFLETVGPFHAKVVNDSGKLEIIRTFEICIDSEGETNGSVN